MRPSGAIVLLVASALLGGCFGDEDVRLFSNSEAEETLGAWIKALQKEDVAAMAARSQTPFRFRTRTWDTPGDLKANLRGEMSALLRELDQENIAVDYFAYAELCSGKWPRGDVPDDPESRCRALGVDQDGYLAWFHVGRRPILEFVLNPGPAGRRLFVSAVITSR